VAGPEAAWLVSSWLQARRIEARQARIARSTKPKLQVGILAGALVVFRPVPAFARPRVRSSACCDFRVLTAVSRFRGSS
jgi:hypothetical protein